MLRYVNHKKTWERQSLSGLDLVVYVSMCQLFVVLCCTLICAIVKMAIEGLQLTLGLEMHTQIGSLAEGHGTPIPNFSGRLTSC